MLIESVKMRSVGYLSTVNGSANTMLKAARSFTLTYMRIVAGCVLLVMCSVAAWPVPCAIAQEFETS